MLYEVITLTARIINAQQDEIATMQGWLRDRGQPVPETDYEIEFGRAAVVREGRHVTVVALSLMVHHAAKAAAALA